MEVQIAVDSKIMSVEQMEESLVHLPILANKNIAFETRKSDILFRGMDPTILVAIVGASGAVLGALITGLLQMAQQARAKKIIVKSGDEFIEIEGKFTEREVETLIEKLRLLKAQSIKIAVVQ